MSLQAFNTKEQMHYSQRREAMGNTRSANGPTNVEVVFLFYDSFCFMIVTPFILKVAKTHIEVVHSSLILGPES